MEGNEAKGTRKFMKILSDGTVTGDLQALSSNEAVFNDLPRNLMPKWKKKREKERNKILDKCRQ